MNYKKYDFIGTYGDLAEELLIRYEEHLPTAELAISDHYIGKFKVLSQFGEHFSDSEDRDELNLIARKMEDERRIFIIFATNCFHIFWEFE